MCFVYLSIFIGLPFNESQFQGDSPKCNSQSSDDEKSSERGKKVQHYIRSGKFKQLNLNFFICEIK